MSKFSGAFLIGFMLAAGTLTQTASAQMSAAPAQANNTFDDNIDNALDTLTTQLKLNAEQRKQARVILEEKQTQVLAVRKEFPAPKPGSAPPPEGPVKMRQIMQAAHTRMLAMLNPEQQKKYDELDTLGSGQEPK